MWLWTTTGMLLLLLVQPLLGQQPVGELTGEGIGNKAGVKARLSQKGVNYIATFLKDLLIEQVAGANSAANEEVNFQTDGSKIRLSEWHLRVDKGPAPLRTTTDAPRQAIVELPAIGFESTARLDAGTERVRFKVPTAMLWLNVSATRHAQGAANFRIEKCQLRLEKPPSITLEMVQHQERADSIKKALTESGPAMLEQLVCSRVTAVLEERVNQRFGLLPSKLSLAQLNGSFIVDELLRRVGARRQRHTRAAGSGADPDSADELFSSFNMSRADALFLDYTIVDIRADRRGIEVDSSGEVSLRGRGGTPFGPIALELPEQPSDDQMLQMAVADFMPNSLLHHGHSIGLFNARVDPSTPHFGPLMRTSCSPTSGLLFCLGDFFPSLRHAHPEQGLALAFSTLKPPVIRFRPQSAGGIAFSLVGKIAMSLLGANGGEEAKEVAQMQINVHAHMKIRLSSTTVRPKVTLDKIVLKTLTPGALAQEELDRSVVLAREVLQRMVNDMLRTGIPIPVHPLLRLHKPRVKIQERHLLLLTNVEFNEPLMRQITGAGLDAAGRN